MARIRNVKPEFLIDPELQDLEIGNPGQYVMLTYEGLWCQSSKNGVFWYEPRVLKLGILPFIQYDLEKTLGVLYQNGYIKHFQKDGKKYGFIVKFSKHQTISGQEVKQPSKYPDYVEGSDWEVTSKSLGSEREAFGQADLGLRTLDIGLRTTDAGGACGDNLPASFRIQESLISPIRKTFEHFNPQGFTAPALEDPAIIDLAEKFSRLGRDNPGDFARVALEKFYALTVSGDKFWSGLPFTPSTLNNPKILDRVIAIMKTAEKDDASWVDALEKQGETA